MQGLPFQRGFGDRIDAPGMKGMTTSQTSQPEAQATPNAVTLDRFARILRARGIESAARRQQRRNHELIAPDQQNAGGAHLRQRLHDFSPQTRKIDGCSLGTRNDQQSQATAGELFLENRP